MLSGTRDSRNMKVAMLFHPLALSTLFMVLVRDWNIQIRTRFSLEALICRPGGVFFTAKDPAANQAILPKDDLYFIPVQTYAEDPPPPPHKISLPNDDGSASSPKFSPDGKSAAFLGTMESASESGQQRIFLVRDTDAVDDVIEITTSDPWDLQPLSLTYLQQRFQNPLLHRRRLWQKETIQNSYPSRLRRQIYL